jgi:diacylglycerol kinase family enzyme
VLQSVSPLSTLQYWLGALVQSHLKQQQVQYWRTKDAQITVVGEGEVLVQTDGEMAGQLPMSMRVVPRALSVIVP